jgi:hypothetical protein
VEFAGGFDGVLTDHRVGDEKNFGGLQFFFEIAQLVHQFIVNVETTRSVHEDDVAGRELGFLDSAANDFERLVGAFAGPDRGANRFGNLGELLARGGAIDVGRDNERAMAIVVKPLGKFAGGGGLTGTLQTYDHPD